MNPFNTFNGIGLDGRSVVTGAGLVLAGMVAAHSGPIVPMLLIGGIAYVVGSKKGWWNGKSQHARPNNGQFAPAPAQATDWRQQAWQAGWRPEEAGSPARPTQPVPQREPDQEIRIPVTNVDGYRRTVGNSGEAIV